MPGTVKIWWHDGAVNDIRYHDIPVVAEPEVGFETVMIGPTASASGPAPANTTVAIIETDVDFRYTVRPQGVTTEASVLASKPVLALNLATISIGASEGQSISFIEV